MKVLLISHTCQSLSEGQPRAAEIAARLDGELLVLTPNRWRHYGKWRQPEFPGSAAYRLVAGKVRLPWAGPAQCYLHRYPGLAALVRRFRPDVIDVWEEPWSLVSAQVCRVRQRWLPEARVISETEQNLERDYPPPFRWLRRYTFEHADCVIGRSPEALGVVRRQGYAGRAATVPNAVDPALFQPMDREECRARLGLRGIVAGYVGRMVQSKGLMELVEALPLCPKTVTLLLIGSGEYLEAVQARAAELGVRQRVRTIAQSPPEELPRLMNAMDFLVLPSRTTPTWKEQFGRVIIEAHACGVPVVGSSSGAIPEVIGEGGLVFPERDAAALAACIRKLAGSAETRRCLGEAGRRQVLTRYTWGRVAERMVEIYRQTLAGGTQDI